VREDTCIPKCQKAILEQVQRLPERVFNTSIFKLSQVESSRMILLDSKNSESNSDVCYKKKLA
jgi:hypothetical protein